MATPRSSLHGRRVRLGRLKSAWIMVRWPLFAMVVLAALSLGYVGFGLYFSGQGESRSVTDIAYLTLQLFVLESGSVPESGAPWQLEVARLLAPATTGFAIALALATALREQISEVRLRFRKDHVVVCGLGGKGFQLARQLHDAGYRVVAIEQDARNPAVAEMRRLGALVVEGDARTSEVLQRARVDRAEHLVALIGADDGNAEVAICAGDLAPDKGRALRCLAHIRDPELCALLRSEELAAAHNASFRLDFFNIFEQGARVLLQDYPQAVLGPGGPALAVIGLTPVGQAIVVEAARRWRLHPDAQERPIRLTVVDPDAERIVDSLKARYPQLGYVAEVRPILDRLERIDYSALSGGATLDRVFVCVDDDSDALGLGLRIRRSLRDTATPVVVELTRSAGLAGLLQHPDAYEGLDAFNLFELTLEAELLLGGTYEILARAIHGEYLDEQRRQGTDFTSNPSLVPWEQLSESLRESNRDQAAHIGTKLATIGCEIAPLGDWDADQLTFADADVERLAELEHERWVDQRVRDGWSSGPKDVAAKVSPYLIPWAQLSEEVKEWDRRAVRGIPAFLARAGYQIVGGHIA